MTVARVRERRDGFLERRGPVGKCDGTGDLNPLGQTVRDRVSNVVGIYGVGQLQVEVLALALVPTANAGPKLTFGRGENP